MCTTSVTENGVWQNVLLQFLLPENTTGWWLALEKGTNAETEIDCWIDNVSVTLLDSCESTRLLFFKFTSDTTLGTCIQLTKLLHKWLSFRECIRDYFGHRKT